MKIVKEYKSTILSIVLQHEDSAREAYNEVINAIHHNVTNGDKFILNNSKKNINGVTKVKEGIISILQNEYGWETEYPITYLSADASKGGPIDAYKKFGADAYKVGFEFETGNVASVHRSINKLHIGITTGNLNMGILILPMKSMSYYLTDRAANYEEIEPYLLLWSNIPLAVIGFDADIYDPSAPILSKGSDGNHH
jgi:hypothetical protein